MGLLCYPFSLDWETFSGAKVNKKVFYAKKMWEYIIAKFICTDCKIQMCIFS